MSKTALTQTLVFSWFILCLGLLAACLFLYLKPAPSTPEYAAPMSTQAQTSALPLSATESASADLTAIVLLDCEFAKAETFGATAQVRRCFDQLLQTSHPLPALQDALQQELTHQLTTAQMQSMLRIWEKYHFYHTDLQKLSISTSEQHLLDIALLRHQYFEESERLGLFGAENPAIELQAKQLSILQNHQLNPVKKAEHLAQIFAQSSEDAHLVRQLQHHSLKQLQQELRVKHATAEDVKHVLSLLS